MTVNECKWLGFVVSNTGAAFTAWNIYPEYLFVNMVGTFIWLVAAWMSKDRPLLLGGITGLGMSLIGITKWAVI